MGKSEKLNSASEKEILKKETKDFFYSKYLGKYVSFQPLRIDDRVVKAASELDIKLTWDDEGRIENITFPDSKRLSEKLGASLLSPTEFWKIYEEAKQEGNTKLVDMLQSDQFVEWLDVIYEKDAKGNVYMVEHPKIVQAQDGIKYEGERRQIEIPEGRPGWFNPANNIDQLTGFPKNVELKRGKARDGETWKYWSVFKINEPVAAIRGYVTSSGTPSFDCDMPLSARQPVLMLRESRKELLESEVNPTLALKAKLLIEKYLLTIASQPGQQNRLENETFYRNRSQVFDFIAQFGEELAKGKDKESKRIRERLVDMLGLIRILAKQKKDLVVIQKISNIGEELFGIKKDEVNYNNFSKFIYDTRRNLEEAIDHKKRIVFVMGHKNPDTDTAISSLLEAYRNQLFDKDAVYIPVVQGKRIPDEIRRLLGDQIADNIVLSSSDKYEKALNSGQARWILVDQNISEVQKFVTSIIDHHTLAENALKQELTVTWEMLGSTTALIAQKFEGMGLDMDQELARILLGATLMDTENRSRQKTTFKDFLIMDELRRASEIRSENGFYQDLMNYLLNTEDADLLFNRDYKQDWGVFGFAVAKVKGVFDQGGKVKKEALLNDLVNLASSNNKKKNFPLTIVKLVDYLDNNETVNRERMYFIFNDNAIPEFKDIAFKFASEVIKNEYRGKTLHLEQLDNAIDYWGSGLQLSRKVTAPLFETLVKAFNEYYFSSKAKLYVKRDFLRISDKLKKNAQDLQIDLSVDSEGRINNISFNDLRRLLDSIGLRAMSLSEYWKVLEDAKASNDEQMLTHLRFSGFVEFLDSVIIDGKYLIDHPRIIKTGEGYKYEGERKLVNIPVGVPGLISPADIDMETGFPKVVQKPDKYDDKTLWRYWSPDGPICVATRGHIFLLNQSSFDTKIHPDDELSNLGIRPCSQSLELPIIRIEKGENGLRVRV